MTVGRVKPGRYFCSWVGQMWHVAQIFSWRGPSDRRDYTNRTQLLTKMLSPKRWTGDPNFLSPYRPISSSFVQLSQLYKYLTKSVHRGQPAREASKQTREDRPCEPKNGYYPACVSLFIYHSFFWHISAYCWEWHCGRASHLLWLWQLIWGYQFNSRLFHFQSRLSAKHLEDSR